MNTENHTVTIPMSDYVAMKESKEMLEKLKHTFGEHLKMLAEKEGIFIRIYENYVPIGVNRKMANRDNPFAIEITFEYAETRNVGNGFR